MLSPNKVSAYNLFEPTRRFLVPLFQRSYVWNREEHWEPLWEDILRKAEESMERRKAPPHFLGAVVLYHVTTTVREAECREIIDGQQRLTTLQLFLAAFREHARGAGDPSLAQFVDSITANRKGSWREEEVYKVWPTKADQAMFCLVMNAATRGEIEERVPLVRRKSPRKPDPRHPFVEAFLYFHDSIGEFLKGGGAEAALDRAFALLDVVRNRMEFVVMELEAEDDPQVIFESLNSRGVPLLPSDLVRNFLLHRARVAGKDMQALYDRHWRKLDEEPGEVPERPFWKEEQRQGRMERPRIDLFLFHYLTLRRQDEVQITHLYRTFCDWWDTVEERDPDETMADMATHAKVFRSLLFPSVEDELGQRLTRIRTMDTSTVYPVLLHVLGPGGRNGSKDDKEAVVSDIESFLVRRMVCGLTTKHYNRLFLAMTKRVASSDENPSVVVRDHLLGSLEETVRWPDDGEFKKAWLQRPVGDEIKRDRIVMLLQSLERKGHGPRQEDFAFKGPLTVEHVMPCEWQKAWPAPSGQRHGLCLNEEAPEEARERLIQTMGNLTLLTQSLNSAASNAAYTKKRGEITRQSTLLLNHWFVEREIWDEAAIHERGMQLAEDAVKVWAKPTAV